MLKGFGAREGAEGNAMEVKASSLATLLAGFLGWWCCLWWSLYVTLSVVLGRLGVLRGLA